MREILVPKDELYDLYWNKGIKPKEIAKKFGIKNERTIIKKLKKYGIPRKTVSEALTVKFKKPFSGDLLEHAFFLGLRVGDFYAKWARKSIRFQTSTTHSAQVELLRDSLESYGQICTYLSSSKSLEDEWFIYVDLHNFFEFLIDKPEEVPFWILDDDDCFYAFLSAYCDCELNWNFTKSHGKYFRYSFRLRTGDRLILEQIQIKLISQNSSAILRLDKLKGSITGFGVYNSHMYELTLNRKEDIVRIICLIMPFSKHSEKIRKMNLIVDYKNSLWSDAEPHLNKIKDEIKKELLKNCS